MVWSPSRSLPSIVAACCLTVIGLAGLRQPMRSAPGSGWISLGQPDLEAVDTALQQREVVLKQRRDAETLLGQFIRGQMTRHYWGHFASSLTDLGLASGTHLRATVTSIPEGSQLLLIPLRGDEGYGAAVRQRGPRVARWQCRGPLPQSGLGLSFAEGCPPGWQEIDAPQS